MNQLYEALMSEMNSIYLQLCDEQPGIVIPRPDRIVKAVSRCTFRLFDEGDDYVRDPHASEPQKYVSPTFGEYAFRVYYDFASGRVQVDLNRDRMAMICMGLETQSRVFRELVRSILVADPNLF